MSKGELGILLDKADMLHNQILLRDAKTKHIEYYLSDQYVIVY